MIQFTPPIIEKLILLSACLEQKGGFNCLDEFYQQR